MAKDDIELYRKYRPSKLSEVLGQDAAIRGLQSLLDEGRLPHAILLSGPAGTGKTSLSRILKKELKCSDMDFYELNCADTRGIDTIRDIKRDTGMHALDGGKSRIWVWDECAKLTGDAQTAALKLLEDIHPGCYFILCTTDPQKLLTTIKSRCHEVKLQPLSNEAMGKLLTSVSEKERFKLGQAVRDRIIEVAEGGARKALVMLHECMAHDAEKDQLACILNSDTQRQAIDLCRALIKGSKWEDIAKILADIKDDPENVRRAVLGYANAVLLKGNNGRAYLILVAFRESTFACGMPGITQAAYEVASQK